MKKLLFATLTVLIIATSSFAADVNKVNAKSLDNFAKEFSSAQNVEWIARANFSKATFMLDNIKYDVFYDLQGNKIGTSHAIAIETLPTSAKRVFAKRYADYTVKEAIQFDTDDETSYYISAETEKQSVVLRVADGMLSVYKKTVKK